MCRWVVINIPVYLNRKKIRCSKFMWKEKKRKIKLNEENDTALVIAWLDELCEEHSTEGL